MTVSLYFVYMKKPDHRLSGRVCYVGITKNFTKRVADHRKVAREGCGNKFKMLHRAMRKHGAEYFEFIEVAICRWRRDACIAEQMAIIEQRSLSDFGGYNLSHGGDGGRVSTLAAAKISKNKKLLYADPYERARIAAAIRSSEAYLRDVPLRSARAKEIQNRPEVKAKIAAAHTVPATRERRRRNHLAAVTTSEYRERQRAISLEIANRPGERLARRSRSIESQNRPDVRARKSIGAIATWANDDGTRRAIIAKTALRPEVAAKKSASMKAYWVAKRSAAAAVTDHPESLQEGKRVEP